MASNSNKVKPIFFKNKDILIGYVRPELMLSAWEVCEAAGKVIGRHNVEGAQLIKGIWRVYTRTIQARVSLLTKGMSLRNKFAMLMDDLPVILNRNERPKCDKITIKDVPLDVDSDCIKKLLESVKGVKVASEIMFGYCRIPEGGWSDYKSGDRYCYVEQPVPNIPRTVNIVNIQCRLFHKSQHVVAEKTCLVCKRTGHKEGTETCPAYQAEVAEFVVPFRAKFKNNIFSNFYPCVLRWAEENYKSSEHLYQYQQAMAAQKPELAIRIRNAPTPKDAYVLSRSIGENDAWDKIKEEKMRNIIKLKSEQCPEFYDALLASEHNLLVEATMDKYWAAGLPHHLLPTTNPHYYPGMNTLGKILMEQREEMYGNLSQGNPAAPKTSTPAKQEIENDASHEYIVDIEDEVNNVREQLKFNASKNTEQAQKPRPARNMSQRQISSYYQQQVTPKRSHESDDSSLLSPSQVQQQKQLKTSDDQNNSCKISPVIIV